MIDPNTTTAEIALRLKALRESMGMNEREFADKTGVDTATLDDYENSRVEIPVGFLAEAAHACDCDLTALLTGKEGHLRTYSLVRQGQGLLARRHPSYKYRRLADRFAKPGMEPFMVTVPWRPDSTASKPSQHNGEEFIYLLEGRLEVRLGEEIVLMNPSDALYFDSSTPHELRSLDNREATFLDVVL